METKFFKLFQAQKFIAAASVLKEELLTGNVIDPRLDSIWANLADQILAASNPSRDVNVELEYWKEWLSFFLTIIEPKWGRAHKGHIYFRLGFAYTQADESNAVLNFEKAQEEDRISAQLNLNLAGDDLANYCRSKSSYVALSLLERMELLKFSQPAERQKFMGQIFAGAFDRAISHSLPNPDKFKKSLLTLINSTKAQAHAFDLNTELFIAASNSLTYATISSLGGILETILLDRIPDNKMVDKNGKKLDIVTLGTLFSLAEKNALFPNDQIKASCRLVSFLRNRIHSKNTLEAKYPLTPRASHTLMMLLELSIIDWANIVSQQ